MGNKNIVITGVCGLVGSRLADSLIEEGHHVFGVDLPKSCSQTKQILTGYASIDLSCDDAEIALKALTLSNVDILINCAAQQPRPDLPLDDYLKGNVTSIENISNWALNAGVKIFISFSTIAFLDFPLSSKVRINELSKPNPTDFYSLTKYCAESYLKIFSKERKLKAFCFRIPSLVHEEQVGGIVHTFWDQASKNKDIEIYDHGRFKRSLIHVDSIIETIKILIRKTPNIKDFEVLNLGTKDSWTLIEIAKYLYAKTYSIGNVKPDDRAGKICGHWDIDVSRAQSRLNYDPWSTKKTLDLYIQNMKAKESINNEYF